MTYPLLVVCGPTATGKSDVGLKLALRLGGEIISADSMQVYRGFDIGTAKPTAEEQAAVRHHLIDVADPDETFNAARYARMVAAVVPAVAARGRLPIMVGGTGLYIDAATRGVLFPSPGRDESYRRELDRLAHELGHAELHRRLAAVDPESAARIHVNDRVRVIRALEVYHSTGLPLSAHLGRRADRPPYDCLRICLVRQRDELYRRINARTLQMLEAGFENEVRGLVQMGYNLKCGPMTGLGYAEMVSYLRGLLTFDESVGLIQRNTRRYAKRQLTWFRRDPDMVWIDMTGAAPDDVVEQIATLAAGRFCLGAE